MSDTTSQVPGAAGGDPPIIGNGAKAECDKNSSKLWDSERFSDVVIAFSDRKIHAHRLILCQCSEYFDKLCGPDSSFSESKQNEITLLDDDPDALVAMLRHLCNFWLTPPPMSLSLVDKVRYYCHVVVVADKYALPSLTQEVMKSLNTFLTSIEDAAVLLASLKILTDEFGDHSSLDECATAQAKPRMKELADLPDFPAWVSLRPSIFPGLVQNAMAFEELKPVCRWRCAFCAHVMLNKSQLYCCKNKTGFVGYAYVAENAP